MVEEVILIPSGEEVDIINHGVRTKTDKIKRIIGDDFGNLYYLDENNDFLHRTSTSRKYRFN